MITKKTIIEAYLFLRKNNQSIPDEILNFMKDVSLKELENKTNVTIEMRNFAEEYRLWLSEVGEKFLENLLVSSTSKSPMDIFIEQYYKQN